LHFSPFSNICGWIYVLQLPFLLNHHVEANFAATFGYEVHSDLISSVFAANRKLLPDNAVLLQSNTLYDELLFDFEKDLNGDVSDDGEYVHRWSARMLQSAGELTEVLPGTIITSLITVLTRRRAGHHIHSPH